MANKRKEERIDNNCYECAYCVKHYYNVRGTFQTANCMHCKNGNIPLNERKKRIENKARCEYWQPERIQIEQRRESIEKYLLLTAEKLNEIAQILKEDKERKK